MNENIVLVTGMSGAGKSSAMNALEDLGYYCIDNFPKELLSELEKLLETESRYKNIAFAISAVDYVYFVNYFQNISKHMQIIFLDCSDEELLLRYRFTCRQHPMISNKMATTLEEAIEIERDFFDHLQENAKSTIHIDTTKLTTAALASKVRHRFKNMDVGSEFSITFQSFGFKRGVPMDADSVIDVRFLPNPFYDPQLRNKTGNNKEVYDYVMEKEETQQFIKYLKDYLDYVFKCYDEQNKSHMIVSIGCTGGQHRSVSICNWLFDQYKDQYQCFKSHRDIGDEEA